MARHENAKTRKRQLGHENTKTRNHFWLRAFSAGFVAAAVLSSVASAQAPAGVQTTGNAQNGKELFLKYSCYACHGYDGHGGAGARLVPMRLTVERFSTYVHNPRQMPPYTARVLSDAQLADLFAYIKSLPESPPAKNIPLLSKIINESQIQKK